MMVLNSGFHFTSKALQSLLKCASLIFLPSAMYLLAILRTASTPEWSDILDSIKSISMDSGSFSRSNLPLKAVVDPKNNGPHIS